MTFMGKIGSNLNFLYNGVNKNSQVCLCPIYSYTLGYLEAFMFPENSIFSLYIFVFIKGDLLSINLATI